MIDAVIMMFLACYTFGNSSSNPMDGVCRFYFLKHGHIPGWQCQDSSGSNCVRMVGRSMKNHSHSWIGSFESETLNSLMHILIKSNITTFISIKRCNFCSFNEFEDWIQRCQFI